MWLRCILFLNLALSIRYLHEVCLPSVVHRNFKSANILLDEELNPHLSDCGLAALTPNTERQVINWNKITISYFTGLVFLHLICSLDKFAVPFMSDRFQHRWLVHSVTALLNLPCQEYTL